MKIYYYVILAIFFVLLLFGILNGDFGETWRNGATL
jgi:hypothetical protein